ncbi:MAG: SpvB/TcaC N-terminal domain-containing protein [Bacteroidota bacterium]
MPKGGGTAHGVDENFHMDAFTGTASFGIPFPLPPARALTPSLGASYHSSSGNGLLGCGFNLSEASVSIKTNRGIPKYDGTDIYTLGGSGLVPKKDEAGVYLERHRGSYPLIQFDQQHNY